MNNKQRIKPIQKTAPPSMFSSLVLSLICGVEWAPSSTETEMTSPPFRQWSSPYSPSFWEYPPSDFGSLERGKSLFPKPPPMPPCCRRGLLPRLKQEKSISCGWTWQWSLNPNLEKKQSSQEGQSQAFRAFCSLCITSARTDPRSL